VHPNRLIGRRYDRFFTATKQQSEPFDDFRWGGHEERVDQLERPNQELPDHADYEYLNNDN
jgi:hypothetical protein